MKLRPAVLWLFAVGLVAIPALAQTDIYDNGPSSGRVDAWTINNGFVVSDSFQLASDKTVSGLVFTTWVFPLDILETAEVSISSSEFGGTMYFDAIVNFTQSNCEANAHGFQVCDETGSFGPVNLNAGTYWLNLQNAVVNTGDPIYWDENSGPSMASQNSVGTIPSESFTILGGEGTTTSTNETTPEPNSGLLLATGALTVVGLLGRKFF